VLLCKQTGAKDGKQAGGSVGPWLSSPEITPFLISSFSEAESRSRRRQMTKPDVGGVFIMMCGMEVDT
jgi:hypothetical protein